MAELRCEIKDFTAAVLDGYCSASGKCRTEVVNEILNIWATQKHHESVLILRVAGVDPMQPDTERKGR